MIEGGEVGAEHIAPRREYNSWAPRRPNVLYCYGVDFMSSKEVMEMFGDFQPQQVEWLDDSSCNIVFEGEEVPEEVMKKLASEVQLPVHQDPEKVWTRTRKLVAGQAPPDGKVRRTAPRELQVQLRIATEADRKDPKHSGHTDSVYYTFVQEQQAMAKQSQELRRMKKRQRSSRFPAAPAPAPEATLPAAAADGAAEMADAMSAAVANGVLPEQNGGAAEGAAKGTKAVRAARAARAGKSERKQPPPGAKVTALAPDGKPLLWRTVPCRHFAKGTCLAGEICNFLHPQEGTPSTGEGETASVASGSSALADAETSSVLSAPMCDPGSIPCRFWLQGRCRAGKHCCFRHSSADRKLKPLLCELGKLRGAQQAAGSVAATPRSGSPAPSGAEGCDELMGNASGAQALPRLGFRGVLDPLLYLRATAAAAADTANRQGGRGPGEAQRKADDLMEALRMAEAEYAAVVSPELQAGQTGTLADMFGRAGAEYGIVVSPAVPDAAAAKGKQKGGRHRSPGPLSGTAAKGHEATPGRQRERTPGRLRERMLARAGDGAATEPAGSRGAKRRPMEQEPRPVSGAPPPTRRVLALPQVESFLQEHKVRCSRLRVQKTFRAIMGDITRSRKAAGQVDDSKQGLAAPSAGKADGGAPGASPWEQFMRENPLVMQKGHFLHVVSCQVGTRHVLAVVPHPCFVDFARVAKAAGFPGTEVKRRKLQDIVKSTNFPIFVCPPFGHPKDSEGRDPLILVDSSVTELKKPAIFDCGTVALVLLASEFLRCTGAACIEGLATGAPMPMASAESEAQPVAPRQPASVASEDPAAAATTAAEVDAAMES